MKQRAKRCMLAERRLQKAASRSGFGAHAVGLIMA
jgi:hypothetical protein